MAVFTTPFTTPANYTYDNTKIDVTGGLAVLKDTSLWSSLQAYWRMEESSWSGTPGEVIDSSGNSQDGQANNGATTTLTGKVGRGGSFGGTNQEVILPLTAYADADFTVAFWAKTAAGVGNKFAFTSSNVGAWTQPLWLVRMNGSFQAEFTLATTALNTVNVTGPVINDGAWHFIVAWRESNMAYLQVDNATPISAGFVGSLATLTQHRIGNRFGASVAWDGTLDEMAIWDRVLTISERTLLYNSNSGRIVPQYSEDSPPIYKTAGDSDLAIFQWNNFVVTQGVVEGSLAYQLSNDGVTWYYWDGGAWSVAGGGNYNTEVTVNANIASFPTAGNSIYARTFLNSDGTQLVEIDEIQITYSTNQTPAVDAGSNKTAKDNQFIAPFSDATFSDPDGTIDFARYKVDGEVDVWTVIPQGAFGTLLEAVQAFTYQYNNLGSLTTRLQVEDDNGATAEDSLVVTVEKYTRLVNIKSSVSGEHLAGVQFDPGDGTGFSTEISPFSYDWSFGVFDISIFRDVFNQVNIPISVSDESDLTFLIAPVEILNIAQASVGILVDSDTLCLSAWLSQNGIIVTSSTSCAVQLVDCSSGTVLYTDSSATQVDGHFTFSVSPSGLPHEGVYYLKLSIVNNGITAESTYPVGTIINRNLMDENLSNHKEPNTVGEGVNDLLDMVFGDIDLNSDDNSQTFFRRDGTKLKVYDLVKTIKTLPSYIGRILRS